MNRRKFGLLGASSALALGASGAMKAAAATADQAASLQTTLTPFGAERAGNADGSIPAWTGGMTTMPAGVTSGQGIMPDFYASDAKVVSINASNMAQYADRLSDGTKALMTRFSDFRIDVYPTHRPACAPQYVYDNIAKNAVTAQVHPGGGRFGFLNAFGGTPFPIPDPDPDVAGAQIMLNHETRWLGHYQTRTSKSEVMQDGTTTLAGGYTGAYHYWYYDPDGSYDTWNKYVFWTHVQFVAPPASLSEQIVDYQGLNPLDTPTQAWIYLAGQGRVRKAPELQYDNPQASDNGASLYDENYVFNGALNKYDWKFVEKKEMYVPYNTNKLFGTTAAELYQTNFVNPDALRWELHRVWVVDATLHPGERHVVPHRRFYFDEDTWGVVLSDGWDAGGNLWRVGQGYPEVRPDMPGVNLNFAMIYDLQRGLYTSVQGITNDAPYNGPVSWDPIPPQQFNPQAMAASNQY
jgi:hypothetical protein